MKYGWTKLLLLISVFGPATITAISDNDAAGVATYSLAGARYGYGILVVLFIVTFLLAITQEMGVRLGVVTGKGLGDLIRERFGIRFTVLVFSLLVIANMSTIIANVSAIKAVAMLFHLSPVILILSMITLAFLFITRGNYRLNQNLFLIGSLLYFAYVFSAIKTNPNWGDALSSLVIPKMDTKIDGGFILASLAILGTTVTPWGQFFVQSFVNDKHIDAEHLNLARFEALFGALITNFFSFFMIVATASTLYTHHINLVSGEQAALAIKPFAGSLASFLFGFGMLNAGFMGMVIIALSTAYAFAEFFGVEGSLDKPFKQGPLFYGLFLTQLVLAGLVVFLPGINLFRIVFYTQGLNGILLPAVIIILLKFSNNRQLLGDKVNSRWYNGVSWFFTGLIIFASLVGLVQYFT